MRVSQAVIALSVLCGSVSAFTAAPSFGVARQTKLFMSDAVEAEVAEVAEVPAAPKPAPSGLSMAVVRKSINDMTATNFSATLATLEPFFLNEAGVTLYTKSMKRIAHQAKQNGVEVPAGYAKDAAWSAKRRAKQDAFIQMKEAGRADREAAEAAAAAQAIEDAAAAEVAAAEEAAAAVVAAAEEAAAAEAAAAEAAAAPAEEAAPAAEDAVES